MAHRLIMSMSHYNNVASLIWWFDNQISAFLEGFKCLYLSLIKSARNFRPCFFFEVRDGLVQEGPDGPGQVNRSGNCPEFNLNLLMGWAGGWAMGLYLRLIVSERGWQNVIRRALIIKKHQVMQGPKLFHRKMFSLLNKLTFKVSLFAFFIKKWIWM